MKTFLIATLALLLSACSSTGNGTYQPRGPYGSSVQPQPVATNETLGQSLRWGGKRIPHHHFQNCSQL